MAELTPFLIIAIIMVLAGFFMYQKHRQIGDFCARHNLTNHNEGFFSDFNITGRYDDLDLKLWRRVEGHGKHRRYYNLVQLSYTSENNVLIELKPEIGKAIRNIPLMGDLFEKARNKMKDKFNVQDFIIGDKKFDDTFIISGGPEEDIKNILNPTLRNKILKLKQPEYKLTSFSAQNTHYFKLYATPDYVLVEKRDGSLDNDYYTELLKMMSDLAYTIKNY